MNCTILWIFTFLLRELHLWSQENFWQVSNYLSRKNIWDLAEHLVLVPNFQKSKTPCIYIQWGYISENIEKTTILWVFTFLLRELHLWFQENFWQVSNYLSRKTIWDLAEHLVLVPNFQESKTPCIYTQLEWNVWEYRQIYKMLWIFTFFLRELHLWSQENF